MCGWRRPSEIGARRWQMGQRTVSVAMAQVLAEGMKLANERIADHQRAWDAHRAANRPAQSGKPNRGPGKAPAKPVLGLKALARADAAAKGPEALAEVQERQRAAAQADRAKPGRSDLDREIRQQRKGTQGAKPAAGGRK